MKQLRLFAGLLFSMAIRLVARYPKLGNILRPIYNHEATKTGIAWVRLLLMDPCQIRFFIPWYTSLKKTRNAVKDEVPWVTFKAKRWLESFLTPGMNVLEFGSGGSTIFIAKRVKKLVSVEHDRGWYELTKEALTKNNIHNCQYLLLEPQHAPEGNYKPNDPYGFSSSLYPDMSFESYVKSVAAFPDESFDLVFVDGRARPSCIFHALHKVRFGGYLMLDNSERTRYQAGKDLLKDWEETIFFGPGPYNKDFWQTSIYNKKSS